MNFKQLLALLLAGAVAIPAQQSAQLMSQKPGGLVINVVQGEGARNIIRSRTAVAPVVEVKDADGKPVPGAEVVFQLPLVGPSGVFSGWLKTQTVRTDEQGQATVTGYTPNTEAGRFNIKVTATSGTQSGSVVIAQTNVEGGSTSGSGGRSGWWKVALVVGGGALAGGIIAGTRNGNGATAAPATTPVTITAGAVTVGNPR